MSYDGKVYEPKTRNAPRQIPSIDELVGDDADDEQEGDGEAA